MLPYIGARSGINSTHETQVADAINGGLATSYKEHAVREYSRWNATISTCRAGAAQARLFFPYGASIDVSAVKGIRKAVFIRALHQFAPVIVGYEVWRCTPVVVGTGLRERDLPRIFQRHSLRINC